MWTCTKCNTVNEDLYTICPKCGASRSAGRFGSSSQPQVKSTAVQPAAAAKPAEQPAKPVPAAPPAYYTPDLSKVHAGRCVRLLGRILAVLLPLVCIMYFIAQYESLHAKLISSFLPASITPPSFVTLVLYIIIAAAAALLSALPGVWTLSLGKALHRLARMEELL